MKNLIQETHNKSMTKKVPVIKPGYTVEVDTIIREEKKSRVQKFRGLVLAVTGVGANEMITVRKISSGVGVEKKLPIHSPNIGAIKVIKTEPTRRSKLYFMRDRVGKNAMRIKKGKAVFMTEEEAIVEEEVVEANEVVVPVESDVVTENTEAEVTAGTQEVVAEAVETPVDEVKSEETAEPAKKETQA